jgi:hypothetical protein
MLRHNYVLGTILIAVGLTGSSVAQTSDKPMTATLKEIAGYAVAESGSPMAPAWSDADEVLSNRSQTVAASVIAQRHSEDREGLIGMKRACGLFQTDQQVEGARALNRLWDAAELRMELHPGRHGPDDDATRKTTMVALNRVDSYATGYETATFDTITLLGRLDPGAKARLCKALRNISPAPEG